MGITINNCSVCGVTIPIVDGESTDICPNCNLQLNAKIHEDEWKKMIAGHTCASGNCNL